MEKKTTTNTTKVKNTKAKLEAQEALKKLAEPIVLKSPLEYKPQTVVITELDQKDKDQLMFSQLGMQTGILTNILYAVNDLLLLFEAYAKKNGIPTEKIVNGKIVDYTSPDFTSGKTGINELGVDKTEEINK